MASDSKKQRGGLNSYSDNMPRLCLRMYRSIQNLSLCCLCEFKRKLIFICLHFLLSSHAVSPPVAAPGTTWLVTTYFTWAPSLWNLPELGSYVLIISWGSWVNDLSNCPSLVLTVPSLQRGAFPMPDRVRRTFWRLLPQTQPSLILPGRA